MEVEKWLCADTIVFVSSRELNDVRYLKRYILDLASG